MTQSPATILVVEDEPMILMDLSFAIEDEGFAVLTASHCAEALEILENRSVSAAVLDVNLGRGETCEPIANWLEQRGIPYFLHTGDLHRQGELIERIGARVVNKPAPSEAVAAEVRKLVSCQAG